MSKYIQCPNPDCGNVTVAAGIDLAKPIRCTFCGQSYTPADSSVKESKRLGSVRRSKKAELPAQIGRYQIRGKLGSGQFGTVYRAYDPQLDREIALKVPNPGTLNSEKAMERFLREAKAAAGLRHPNIVPIFDAGSDGESSFIASELIVGQKLADTVPKQGTDLARAARLVRELAEALAYAHSRGIIHRDVKPDNILVDESDHVHLADFGLASREEESRVTKEGALMGTPSYMAPEQARGQKGKATPAADQYSAGVLFYELITGDVPFDGLPDIVLYHHIHTKPQRPSRRRSEIPPELEAICLKAMAKNPDDRYPDCKAFADDLGRWIDGERPKASQTAKTEPVRSPKSTVPSAKRTSRLSDDEDSPPSRTVRQSKESARTYRERRPKPKSSGSMNGIIAGGVACLLLIVGVAASVMRCSPSPRSDGTSVAGFDASGVPGLGGANPNELPAVPAGFALPRVKWADLPQLAEVAPRWVPVDAATADRIKTGREQATKGVESFESRTLSNQMLSFMKGPGMGGPPRPPMMKGKGGVGPPPGPQAPVRLPIPKRLFIAGNLMGVRCFEDRVWVAVGDSTLGLSPVGGCLVEFKQSNLPTLMADYRVGERVRVLVSRAPQPALAAFVDPNAPAEVAEMFQETRYLLGSYPVAYWSFVGEGIEKSNQSNTWIDRTLGRAVAPANADELRRSPSSLCRDLPNAVGVTGRMTGTFRSYRRAGTNLEVILSLANTAEGNLTVTANLGSQTKLEELLDYAAGDEIEAEVITRAPPTPQIMNFKGPLGAGPPPEAFSFDPVLFVDCLRIQKLNQPATLVVSDGPRRTVVVPAKTTVDTVHAAPEKCLGQEVTWTGKLKKIRGLRGEAHLVVGVTDSLSGATAFEAFATQQGFMSLLNDLTSEEESSSKADTVTVTGTVSLPSTTAIRLDKNVGIVLKLVRIEKSGVPGSRVEVGKSYAEKPPNNTRDSFSQILRDMPPPGTEVTIQGRFASSGTGERTMSLYPLATDRYTSILCEFPATVDTTAIKDFKYNDSIEVVGTVEEDGAGASSQLKLRGKSFKRIGK